MSGAVGSLRAYFIDPLDLAPDLANSLWGIVSSSALIGRISPRTVEIHVSEILAEFKADNRA
ncbi:MAG: D-xylose transporter XylE, partial [Limisphaerales bacterium]